MRPALPGLHIRHIGRSGNFAGLFCRPNSPANPELTLARFCDWQKYGLTPYAGKGAEVNQLAIIDQAATNQLFEINALTPAQPH